MHKLIGLLGIILFLSACKSDSEEIPQTPPNVLFIAIDDLNDWVEPLKGHPQVQTPHMNRLASQGVTFTNAHCQAPLCNPSRTSIMTGLRPSTTGVYSLSPWFRKLEPFQDLVSLPQYFSQQGYTTYMTGKLYHGGYGRQEGDTEWDHIGPGAGVGVKPEQKLVNTPAPHPLVDWGLFPHSDSAKGDWKVMEWAVNQLKDMPEEPFFLGVGFFLPHVPCYATERWFDLYPENITLPPVLASDREDTPRYSWYLHWKLPEPRLKFLQEANEHHNLVRSYLASISFVDHLVGKVLDALEASGKADNTIIVLWSDHGFHLGEKLITGKNTLWDRSTRVPLIFAGPGIQKGELCAEPAELLDLYPSLIDLCGLDPHPNLEGHSLVPQLQEVTTPREWPAITTHGPGNYGIRTKEWRYILYADGSEEFYDMKNDPNEFTNLAYDPEYASQKAELMHWLPQEDASPAEGSKARLIERKPDGRVFWELEEIGVGDSIPEI
ncbi:MAG: sulfatase [Bacteroidota bacterium]